jgi:glucose/arabinose dehydrogenase
VTLPARRLTAILTSALVLSAALLPVSVSAAGPRSMDGATGVSGGSAAPASVNTTAAPAPAAVSIGVPQLIIGGLTRPVYATHAGDGSGRLFVVEQAGRIKVRSGGVTYLFLDIRDLVLDTGNEQGLLGLAFHPGYETNRRFYVYYTNNSGDQVVREFRRSATNPRRATRTGSRVIMNMNDPFSNHNGGQMAFLGGYLYIATGDGGSANDPGNRAASLNSLLGKILRINVNRTSSGRNYSIPPTNPYRNRPGLDEIWARGLRNPWRWSFDRLTGDLWIGDVGQGAREEVDRSIRPSTGGPGRGANYGWRMWEGRRCNIGPCSTSGRTFPLAEYVTHTGGCAVTGGYVYRGSSYPSFQGTYFFGDYCSGKVWTLPANAAAPAAEFLARDTALNISSFGETETGELLIVHHGGGVYRVVP